MTGETAPTGEVKVKWSSGTERPKHKAPPFATDCHHHIFDSRFPLAAKPSMLLGGDGNATVADYRTLQRRLGIERNVVVHAAGAYGTDNRSMLDALAGFGPTARGIAVVDTNVSDTELRHMDALGVRGIRVNLVFSGGVTMEMIQPLAHRIHELGWHLQVSMPAEATVELKDVLPKLPTPIVFDHIARIPPDPGIAHPAFKVVRGLIDKGRTWVKLSGAYLLSKVGPPTYADTGAVARAFAQAAPERMLWASNWPHPTEKSEKPDDATLLDLLAEWVPDETVRKRILVDNPEQVYGFPKSGTSTPRQG
jgi:predicted TIM-barrel fold metal-dependent hydrolase